MENKYLSIGRYKSEKDTFEYLHHSTSSIIEIRKYQEGKLEGNIVMDYYEFKEFLKLINELIGYQAKRISDGK